MKQVTGFQKISTVGDLMALLSLLLLKKILSETAELILRLATSITDRFLSDTLDTIKPPRPLAFVHILAVSFMLGSAVRITTLYRVGGWRISFNTSQNIVLSVLARL